ncbi:uncharacterized protein LOC128722658 [Anopheles nili]|uniref:uncharacterized protein LOC128722658 n=1 Tax=Anopheles nili TaxID=185578 RepID=UPI00237AFEC0|nr:uncharacterized protein LOC128722658 [Anopheles nili]
MPPRTKNAKWFRTHDKTLYRFFVVGFWLLIAIATVPGTVEGQSRVGRELRLRPTTASSHVAFAYQYRTDQIAGVQKVPLVPVAASVHLRNQLLQQVSGGRPEHEPHYPTRRPQQAVDQLHTRVDIGQRRRSATVLPVLPVLPVPPGTIVAHSHTQVYRKHH